MRIRQGRPDNSDWLAILWFADDLLSGWVTKHATEVSEAAEIDGASTIQRFLFVTIPLLKPIILFVSIIVMLGSIQVFDEPRILTQRWTGERQHNRRANICTSADFNVCASYGIVGWHDPIPCRFCSVVYSVAVLWHIPCGWK